MSRAMVERLAYRLTPYIVPLALVFPQEHGAGLEAPGAIRSRLGASCEAVEMLLGIRIKPTDGLLLDVPAQKSRREVLGEAAD